MWVTWCKVARRQTEDALVGFGNDAGCEEIRSLTGGRVTNGNELEQYGRGVRNAWVRLDSLTRPVDVAETWASSRYGDGFDTRLFGDDPVIDPLALDDGL